jgi:serine/threonine-protein kinase
MSGCRSGVAAIGTKIGTDLTVLGVLDGGGPEPVYLVLQDQNWCPMACKVFPSFELAEREAGVLSTLSHPNIVPVLGAFPPGHLLMPVLDWPTLGELLKTVRGRRRLGISDALRIAIQIGSALNHVHDRGYLHLGVNPRNIIMTPGGEPILFNFGSARRIDAPRPADVIDNEACIASDEYRSGESGTATDVFGLGTTLYHLLAGKPPFPARPRTIGTPALRVEPEPVRRHRRGVSAALENVVFACLERSPAYRPELYELLPALNDLIRSGPLVLSKSCTTA